MALTKSFLSISAALLASTLSASALAAEALKILSGMGSQLVGRLLMLDGRSMAFTDIRMARQPGCAVCGSAPA